MYDLGRAYKENSTRILFHLLRQQQSFTRSSVVFYVQEEGRRRIPHAEDFCVFQSKLLLSDVVITDVREKDGALWPVVRFCEEATAIKEFS